MSPPKSLAQWDVSRQLLSPITVCPPLPDDDAAIYS